MDVTVSMAVLAQAGAKRPGFFHAVLAEGLVEGDRVRLPWSRFKALNREHFGRWAVGNVLHELVAPVAAAVGLAGCPGCADRQVAANAAAARPQK